MFGGCGAVRGLSRVIVQSFMRRFDPSMLRGLLAAGAAALAVHVVSILIAHLVFRDKDEARRRVLRFCTVFSNAGYMALPLQSALLGETGVFYGAAYVAVFNLVLWSYGLVTMSGEKTGLSAKSCCSTRGSSGWRRGFLCFCCPFRCRRWWPRRSGIWQP